MALVPAWRLLELRLRLNDEKWGWPAAPNSQKVAFEWQCSLRDHSNEGPAACLQSSCKAGCDGSLTQPASALIWEHGLAGNVTYKKHINHISLDTYHLGFIVTSVNKHVQTALLPMKTQFFNIIRKVWEKIHMISYSYTQMNAYICVHINIVKPGTLNSLWLDCCQSLTNIKSLDFKRTNNK